MDLKSLKDINNDVSLIKDILGDLSSEAKKVKNVNKNNLVSSFFQYFIGYLKNNYINIDGRENRKTCWMFILFYLLLMLAIKIVVFMLPFLDFLTAVYWLALLAPLAGIAVRRLHDINFSGWWVLLSLLPFIFNNTFLFLFGTLLLFLLLAIPGDKKANTYGNVAK